LLHTDNDSPADDDIFEFLLFIFRAVWFTVLRKLTVAPPSHRLPVHPTVVGGVHLLCASGRGFRFAILEMNSAPLHRTDLLAACEALWVRSPQYVLQVKQTNKLTPCSRKANRSLVSQEISRSLWSPKVHYRIHVARPQQTGP